MQYTSHKSNNPKKRIQLKKQSLTLRCPPSSASFRSRTKRTVEASEKGTDRLGWFGFEAAILTSAECGWPPDEPVHLRLWVLDLRLGQIRSHCYLRNRLITWFNLRNILDDNEFRLGVVTPSSPHSQSSENEDVALSPWIEQGPFSEHWEGVTTPYCSHRCCICTREDVIPVRSHRKPLGL